MQSESRRFALPPKVLSSLRGQEASNQKMHMEEIKTEPKSKREHRKQSKDALEKE